MNIWLLLALGCTTEPNTLPPESAYSPEQQLVRASMSLRATRPSLVELERIRTDPGQLSALVDDMTRTEAFSQTLFAMHKEGWQIGSDVEPQLPPLGPLSETTREEILIATHEPPLRLVQEIVTAGRPYTDIVTTDELMVNATLAAMIGVDFDADGPEWQLRRWTDGRDAAGVLSSNALWLRHVSSDVNHHRGRAAFTAKAFLCDDLSGREVPAELDLDFGDADAVADAVNSAPGCVSCHQTLDPLAAHFWGFKRYIFGFEVTQEYFYGCEDPDYCYPIEMYDLEAEAGWASHSIKGPSYYGQPTQTLGDLGRAIAADRRFAECTARQFYGWFTHTEPLNTPDAVIEDLTDVFVDSGYDARVLARAAVLHDAMTAIEGTAPDAAGRQWVRSEQFGRMIEDLTGFQWRATFEIDDCEATRACWGEVDLMTSNRFGFHAIAGGIDGYDMLQPVPGMTPGKALTTSELANEAAAYVVAQDFALPPEQRRLLSSVDTGSVELHSVRGALVDLRKRIHGEFVTRDHPSIDAGADLFDVVYTQTGDLQTTWTVVVGALLSDPAAVSY